jgi:hypothetical protein
MCFWAALLAVGTYYGFGKMQETEFCYFKRNVSMMANAILDVGYNLVQLRNIN